MYHLLKVSAVVEHRLPDEEVLPRLRILERSTCWGLGQDALLYLLNKLFPDLWVLSEVVATIGKKEGGGLRGSPDEGHALVQHHIVIVLVDLVV